MSSKTLTHTPVGDNNSSTFRNTEHYMSFLDAKLKKTKSPEEMALSYSRTAEQSRHLEKPLLKNSRLRMRLLFVWEYLNRSSQFQINLTFSPLFQQNLSHYDAYEGLHCWTLCLFANSSSKGAQLYVVSYCFWTVTFSFCGAQNGKIINIVWADIFLFVIVLLSQTFSCWKKKITNTVFLTEKTVA